MVLFKINPATLLFSYEETFCMKPGYFYQIWHNTLKYKIKKKRNYRIKKWLIIGYVSVSLSLFELVCCWKWNDVINDFRGLWDYEVSVLVIWHTLYCILTCRLLSVDCWIPLSEELSLFHTYTLTNNLNFMYHKIVINTQELETWKILHIHGYM